MSYAKFYSENDVHAAMRQIGISARFGCEPEECYFEDLEVLRSLQYPRDTLIYLSGCKHPSDRKKMSEFLDKTIVYFEKYSKVYEDEVEDIHKELFLEECTELETELFPPRVESENDVSPLLEPVEEPLSGKMRSQVQREITEVKAGKSSGYDSSDSMCAVLIRGHVTLFNPIRITDIWKTFVQPYGDRPGQEAAFFRNTCKCSQKSWLHFNWRCLKFAIGTCWCSDAYILQQRLLIYQLNVNLTMKDAFSRADCMFTKEKWTPKMAERSALCVKVLRAVARRMKDHGLELNLTGKLGQLALNGLVETFNRRLSISSPITVELAEILWKDEERYYIGRRNVTSS